MRLSLVLRWTTAPGAIHDDDTGVWALRAEVAEIPFTAFASAKASEQVPGRLDVPVLVVP